MEEGLRIAEAAAHPASLIMPCGGSVAGPSPRRPAEGPAAARTRLGLCQDMDRRGPSGQFPRITAALGAAYTLDGRVAEAVRLLARALEQTLPDQRWPLRRSVFSRWGRHSCGRVAWRRRTPTPSAPWRLPVSTRNGATRRMPCGSLARLPRSATPRRSRR